MACRAHQQYYLQGIRQEELHRHSGHIRLREFFVEWLRAAMHQLRQRNSPVLLQQAHIQARARGIRQGEDQLEEHRLRGQQAVH